MPPLTPGTNKKMTEALKASFASWEKEQIRLNITKGQCATSSAYIRIHLYICVCVCVCTSEVHNAACPNKAALRAAARIIISHYASESERVRKLRIPRDRGVIKRTSVGTLLSCYVCMYVCSCIWIERGRDYV